MSHPSETKRCYPPSNDGCYQVRPLAEFYDGWTTRDTGERVRRYTGWCKKCQRRRATVRECKAREEAKVRHETEGKEHIRLYGLFNYALKPTKTELCTDRYKIA